MKTRLLVTFAVFAGVMARADVRLPSVISDHMVLQAGAMVPVWGRAQPGEEVTVEFARQSQTTNAGADGKWLIKLDKLQASDQAQEMTVQGRNRIIVHDVLVGEVWLASGQSNMEMQIKGKEHGSVDHADEEIAAAKHPTLRQFRQDEPFSIYGITAPPAASVEDRPGAWHVCSPETAADFSACAYFFAREIQEHVKTPVGVVTAAVGGTPVEAWTSLPVQQADPALAAMLADWQKRLAGFDAERDSAAFQEAKKAWLKQRSAAVKAGQPAPKAPLPFKNLAVMQPGGLFNGVIAPLIPYAVRGVIWYQGERNAAGPFTGLYGEQLTTLIKDWRARWQNDFYFAWVQLPRAQKEQTLPSEPKGWGVSVRDEMRRTLAVPNTAMAITIDMGGVKEGHPTNKADYAHRLALLALHDVYKQPAEEWTGPLFRSAKTGDGTMVIEFDHGAGLKAAAGELKGFAIAGADQKFVWAEAKIVDDHVVVSAASVPQPVAVRYGWAGNPHCNLINAAGLPASPFRTDDWN